MIDMNFTSCSCHLKKFGFFVYKFSKTVLFKVIEYLNKIKSQKKMKSVTKISPLSPIPQLIYHDPSTFQTKAWDRGWTWRAGGSYLQLLSGHSFDVLWLDGIYDISRQFGNIFGYQAPCASGRTRNIVDLKSRVSIIISSISPNRWIVDIW